MERAVVRRPSHGRLLAALPAAGRARRARGSSASLAGVAAVGLFAVLARRLAPTPAAAALAAWLFLGGVMSNVVIGRMPFTLGIALAVGAWACARRSRIAAAVLSLRACGRARSPGVFLAVAAVAMLAGRAGQRRRSAPAAHRARARRARPSPAAWRWRRSSPRAARTTSSAPRSGRCCWSASGRSRSSTRRAGPRSGPRRSTSRCSWPRSRSRTRSGQNALRPGVVLGPALLVLFARPRAPRAGHRGDRRGAALPAVAAGRARGRGGARRPVDRGRVPRRGAATSSSSARAPGERARGAAHAQPLGGDLPRRRTIRWPAAGTGSSTARSTRSSTTARTR